ncbi:MAG TPA: class I SAM-dependent methyltransferase [Frankiaceae bacterium]|nr:class I SAM-dependent methyltransferase [Frankiaceae bacterium]
MKEIKTHFNTSPAEYEATRTGHLHDRRRRLVADALRATRPLATVLEVGCGTGALLGELARAFPAVTFRGIDVDEPMVAYATETHAAPNVSFAHADLVDLPAGTPYDLVFSIDMIHHLHDHAAGFAAVRRHLRPGGRWLAIEPNVWHAYVTYQQERMRRAGFDESHFRPGVMEPLLRAAGFAITRRRYAHLFPAAVGSVPEPLARVERALERFRLLGGSVVYDLVAR